MTVSQKNKKALKNPWFLVTVGLVLIVLAINVFMVTTSVVTGPGLIYEDYYQRGVDYEKKMVKLIRDKKELNWDIIINSIENNKGHKSSIEVLVKDENENLIPGLKGMLQIYRPSNRKEDIHMQLTEISKGVYSAEYLLNLQGWWHLIVLLQQDDKKQTIKKKIFIKP
jgi:nitrogen fixation protein FixH